MRRRVERSDFGSIHDQMNQTPGVMDDRVEWTEEMSGCAVRLPMNSFACPLQTPCKSPIKPHALRIVCLNHTTSSPGPQPSYSGLEASSSRRKFSYVSLMGKTRRRA